MKSTRARLLPVFFCAGVLLFSDFSYAQSKSSPPLITVYKTPTWECCDGWVVHLEKSGFKVDKKVLFGKSFVDNKRKLGVPDALRSCHTALVEGYVIEGHVPADLIHKVLKERPQIVGLAVPGMPIGSPGMEGGKPEAYEVFTFDKNGRTTVYAKR